MFGDNVLFIFVYVSLVYAQDLLKHPDNYGPYNIHVANYSDCKGPKAKNLTALSISLDKTYLSVINFTFFADTKFDEIRIHVHNVKDNKKNFLFNYKFNEPCKHYSMAYMIKQYLRAENCLIKKGFYQNQVNIADITVSILGTSFFYGSYYLKADLMSKKGNIGCFTSTVVLSKKP